MNIVKKRSILFIVISPILAIFIIGLYLFYPFPKKALSPKIELPVRFKIVKKNIFEYQGKSQCSAFCAAYILRHFDIEIYGSKVYKEISYKIPYNKIVFSGYVLPKGIIKYLGKKGVPVNIFKGDLESLKRRLTSNNPVIVMVGNGLKWQHYITVIGYDSKKRELYFFDSLKKNDTNSEEIGNLTLSESNFLSVWNNKLPIFNCVYIAVE